MSLIKGAFCSKSFSLILRLASNVCFSYLRTCPVTIARSMNYFLSAQYSGRNASMRTGSTIAIAIKEVSEGRVPICKVKPRLCNYIRQALAQHLIWNAVIHTETHTQTHRHTHRHTDTQTHRHTHTHTQTHTQTHRHTDTHTHTHTSPPLMKVHSVVQNLISMTYIKALIHFI